MKHHFVTCGAKADRDTMAHAKRFRDRDAKSVLRHGPRADDGSPSAVPGNLRFWRAGIRNHRGYFRCCIQPDEVLDVVLLGSSREAKTNFGRRLFADGDDGRFRFRDRMVANAGDTGRRVDGTRSPRPGAGRVAVRERRP
jgi:hypothetical protein